MAKSAIVWFDLPVTDMERARAFYGKLLGADVKLMDGTDGKVALFPMERDGEVGGDLALGEGQEPSATGVTVYFDGGEDLQSMLALVEPAGGKILMEKTDMGPDIGYLAFFLDSEGNRVGLHSRT